MAKVRIDALGYFGDGQKLESGMVIRRYDEIDGNWYQGTVGQISSYNYETRERVTGLALIVDGYAPSPMRDGDSIEIVSSSTMNNQEGEAEIIQALRNLPLSVQITPRNGAYVFQVLEKNGTRATLAEAIEAGVTSLISNLAGKSSVFEYSDLKAQYGSPDNRESAPFVASRRIIRNIRIQERNNPPSIAFDVDVVYASDALPEWFQGLQSIVEDETFTNMLINLGDKVHYLISIAP